MAVNLNPQVIEGQPLGRNLRSIAAHIDDGYYKRQITPGMFVPFATAAHGTAGQSVGLGKWPTIDYPDGVSSYAVYAFERPKMWLAGRIELTVYYTSQTAGTALFSVLVVVNSVKSSGNLSNTGITSHFSVAQAAAGPAAADDEKSFVVYTTTSFNPSARRIGVRIGRDGAGDANNNVLQITEVALRHIPAVQEVDVK